MRPPKTARNGLSVVRFDVSLPRRSLDGRPNPFPGVEARQGGTSGKGGRVGVTTEMEIDVMKGLVLAQHQRIERQRSRMQELERDLRWVFREPWTPICPRVVSMIKPTPSHVVCR